MAPRVSGSKSVVMASCTSSAKDKKSPKKNCVANYVLRSASDMSANGVLESGGTYLTVPEGMRRDSENSSNSPSCTPVTEQACYDGLRAALLAFNVPNDFKAPIKMVGDMDSLTAFSNCQSLLKFVSFISSLGCLIKGVPLPHTENNDQLKLLIEEKKVTAVMAPAQLASSEPTTVIDYLVWILQVQMSQLLIETPPNEQESQRFGNTAFRTWLGKVSERSEKWIASLLKMSSEWNSVPEDKLGACAAELNAYFINSFGNPTRLDYGTGHELHMAIFFYCLYLLQVFIPADYKLVLLRVFKSYIDLVRVIVTLYSLEPAGSKGSWGLDDYHFLPFLWGAYQLRCQDEIATGQVADPTMVATYAKDYFYIDGIRFISQVKLKAPFAEAAPLLHDITAVPNWTKVSHGMVKMYKAEVLGKFPIVQHILFGSIFCFDRNQRS